MRTRPHSSSFLRRARATRIAAFLGAVCGAVALPATLTLLATSDTLATTITPAANEAARPSPAWFPPPSHIPLAVSETGAGTEKATIVVGIGRHKELPFVFDTGSSGLRVFADAELDRPGTGVLCSQTPTSVTYGNPPRITYNGVVCYAPLHFGSVASPALVPFAYLTSASCPPTNPGCTIPNLHSLKQMGGYGVFGAGITGFVSGAGRVPNPLLTFPGRAGSVFGIHLTHGGGELVLGASEPPNAVRFPLVRGTLPGETWSLGNGCLFVNGASIATCARLSFDTGNGVPWIHNVDPTLIPQKGGYVLPGTAIGFAPPGAATPALSIVASASGARHIATVNVANENPIANAAIDVFFDHIATYDYAEGTISFAPAADQAFAP